MKVIANYNVTVKGTIFVKDKTKVIKDQEMIEVIEKMSNEKPSYGKDNYFNVLDVDKKENKKDKKEKTDNKTKKKKKSSKKKKDDKEPAVKDDKKDIF